MNSKLCRSVFKIVLLQFIAAPALRSQAQNTPGEWPVFRGPNRNNTAAAPGLFAPGRDYRFKIIWKKPLGSGYSGVSVLEGLGVTMFSDSTFDFLNAFDPETGRELWRFKIDSTFLGRFGSQNGPISTPVISHGKVVGLGPKGHLAVLEGKTGRLLWRTRLEKDHAALLPFYGFATSPLVYENVLIVQTGGSAGNAITGFDLNSGKQLWTAGSDTIEYQSPVLASLQGREQVLCVGNRRLYSLDPQNGRLFWQHAYGGDASSIGSASTAPLLIGNNRLFLKNRSDGGKLLELRIENENWAPHELWQSKNIRGTYVPPVYHEGNIFGYNGRFLNCLDAATGESVWKSREPGDGFPLLLDGHLVIITKNGKLSLAPAAREGYHEMASLQLFDKLVWTLPSFAQGKIYLRSMSEIACVEIVAADRKPAHAERSTAGVIADSKFAQFVAGVAKAKNKSAAVDAFMSAQKRFPIIESDQMVHFVFRGEATDVALVGEITGYRIEQPMHRVEGTDLYFYSAALESEARVFYRFTKDFQKQIPDPLNPNPAIRVPLYGECSAVQMPKWVEPAHLQPDSSMALGRIDSLAFTSTINDSSRVLEIYLPSGYDRGAARYPVLFVHGGAEAKTTGKMAVSLDNLSNRTVAPVIAVFIPPLFEGGYEEYQGSHRDTYERMIVEEILPLIDRTYRTLPAAEARANHGASFSGVMALYLTLKYPRLFGKLGMQSPFWDLEEERKLRTLITAAHHRKPDIYLEWGKRDLRSPLEGFDLRSACLSLSQLLKEQGLNSIGGEVNDGFGWMSWRNRTDRVLAALFPNVEPPQSKR